jgi:SAM-dependent methyltransferase
VNDFYEYRFRATECRVVDSDCDKPVDVLLAASETEAGAFRESEEAAVARTPGAAGPHGAALVRAPSSVRLQEEHGTDTKEGGRVVRYALAALALKAFSANGASRALYRRIGNTIGQQRRRNSSIAGWVRKGNLMIDLCDRHGAVNSGDTLLELGTGWIHWYAVYLRLHYDVCITMFDVWDNRQFAAFSSCLSKLRALVNAGHSYPQRVTDLLDRIWRVESFEGLYTLLGLEYVVEREGRLDQFRDCSFDCVLSGDVLEHVPLTHSSQDVEEIYRILKPGGHSIHQIGIDDHLSHYDKNESPKNYLRYSDRTWKLFFENDVQYINRLQMSDWLGLFDNAGFSLLERTMQSRNVELPRIDPKYHGYTDEDLSCTRLTIVHRKPE